MNDDASIKDLLCTLVADLAGERAERRAAGERAERRAAGRRRLAVTLEDGDMGLALTLGRKALGKLGEAMQGGSFLEGLRAGLAQAGYAVVPMAPPVPGPTTLGPEDFAKVREAVDAAMRNMPAHHLRCTGCGRVASIDPSVLHVPGLTHLSCPAGHPDLKGLPGVWELREGTGDEPATPPNGAEAAPS